MKLNQLTPFTWKRITIALSLILAASLLRIWPLQSLGSSLAWLTFYPAVMIISVYGGLWAGLLGTLLACSINYFFWFLIVPQPFIKTHGDVIGLYVFALTGIMISSVSEAMRHANRRAIEAERQAKLTSESKSEERYMSTLDNLLEGCQILDHNWLYLYINSTAEKHNRRPTEELIGRSYMEMWPGIENTDVFRAIQKCMSDRTSHIMENEFVFPDGTRGWFSLSIQPVPEGTFILSSDISDRVHSDNYNLLANEILEHLNSNTDSEIMITSVINAIKVRSGYEAIAIRIRDGEDYPYFKTVGFSEEFVKSERQLCSYDKKGNIIRDSKGDPLLECMCGNILCGRVDSSKSFFTMGGSFRSNNTTLLLQTTSPEDRLARTRNKCNSTGYESVGLIPLRSGNEIIGLLQLNDHRKNVFNEATMPFFERMGSSIGIAIMRNKVKKELKELNIELENRISERTNQLLDSNKELESFAYSVSHDLRAPLRHVIGFSEKLESELKDKTNPEITRLTGKIKNSASKMSLLIDELLSYSRLGRTDLKTIKLSLNTIIENIIKEASDITKARKIDWKISQLPLVSADPTLIKLVLQNLVLNALKFTNKKKEAVIEINYEEKNKKEITFYIKDNGAGFNMQYADKLFGVFQRLHSTEEFEGTGIGLATVRRIIKRHNGSVWAEGIENEGATFFFTIPK
jgi:PAS domain S-box-containing protein